MFCSKCGNQIDGATGICMNCNKSVNNGYANGGYSNDGYANNGYANNGYANNGYSNNGYQGSSEGYRETVWKLGGSPLMLTLAILSVTSIVMFLPRLFDLREYYEYFEYMGDVGQIIVIAVLLLIIPCILNIIGEFLIFTSSKRRSMTTTGYSFVSGACIIYMVCLVIGLISAFVKVFMPVIPYLKYIGEEEQLELYSILISLVLVFVLVFIYLMKLLKTVTYLKNLVIGRNVHGSVSIYVIVMLILGTVSCIYYLLSFRYFTIEEQIAMLLSIAQNVVLSILLIQARSKLHRF